MNVFYFFLIFIFKIYYILNQAIGSIHRKDFALEVLKRMKGISVSIGLTQDTFFIQISDITACPDYRNIPPTEITNGSNGKPESANKFCSLLDVQNLETAELEFTLIPIEKPDPNGNEFYNTLDYTCIKLEGDSNFVFLAVRNVSDYCADVQGSCGEAVLITQTTNNDCKDTVIDGVTYHTQFKFIPLYLDMFRWLISLKNKDKVYLSTDIDTVKNRDNLSLQIRYYQSIPSENAPIWQFSKCQYVGPEDTCFASYNFGDSNAVGRKFIVELSSVRVNGEFIPYKEVLEYDLQIGYGAFGSFTNSTDGSLSKKKLYVKDTHILKFDHAIDVGGNLKIGTLAVDHWKIRWNEREPLATAINNDGSIECDPRLITDYMFVQCKETILPNQRLDKYVRIKPICNSRDNEKTLLNYAFVDRQFPFLMTDMNSEGACFRIYVNISQK